MSDIQERVLSLTKLKPKAGESAEDFTKRVVKKVNVLADADAQNWEELGEEAQAWVNKNVSAEENDQELDLLELPEDDEAEAEAEPEAAEDDADAEEEKVVAKTAKKVSNGKAAKVKEPKATKEAKPVKEKKKTKVRDGGSTRGRKPLFPDTGKIKVLVKDNPHRPDTIRGKAFNKVRSGMTVLEAIKAGCPRQQVWSMYNRELISIT